MNYYEIIRELEQNSFVAVRTYLRGDKAGIKEKITLSEAKLDKNHKNPRLKPLFCDEVIYRHENLYILGAGHVGLVLSKMAKLLDFNVKIVDPRPEFINLAADEGVETFCEPYLSFLENREFTVSDYLCIITPGHQSDFVCADLALKSDFGYIGMMGSKNKVASLKKRLLDVGFSEQEINRLYAPIGLNIKAQTPAEIAISILAQMIEKKRSMPKMIFESDIYQALKNCFENRKTDIHVNKCCMVSIILQLGSSPREIGARMLVNSDGKIIAGTVGGGKIEARAIKTAVSLLASDNNFLIQDYDLSNSKAAELGMICGGNISCMFERLK